MYHSKNELEHQKNQINRGWKKQLFSQIQMIQLLIQAWSVQEKLKNLVYRLE